MRIATIPLATVERCRGDFGSRSWPPSRSPQRLESRLERSSSRATNRRRNGRAARRRSSSTSLSEPIRRRRFSAVPGRPSSEATGGVRREFSRGGRRFRPGSGPPSRPGQSRPPPAGDLAVANPSSGAVLFHLGLARYWDGDEDGAFAAWRTTRTRAIPTRRTVRPPTCSFAASRPVSRPSSRASARISITRLGPAEQLAALAQNARGRRPGHTALRTRASAARPADLGPAAVRARRPARAPKPRSARRGRGEQFDKEHPERAFSRLGPLSRRYPRAATVRFHLGVLLLWLSQVEPARRQLQMAAKATKSPLAREAKRLLARLEGVRKP